MGELPFRSTSVYRHLRITVRMLCVEALVEPLLICEGIWNVKYFHQYVTVYACNFFQVLAKFSSDKRARCCFHTTIFICTLFTIVAKNVQTLAHCGRRMQNVHKSMPGRYYFALLSLNI